jgi:PBP1b-binding outer membrane lipoprotein LpoB
MKKISSLLLSLLLLAGCYEDKGNYDYRLDSMNEITSVTFTPSIVVSAEGNMIEVQQALEEDSRTRRVDVVVEQTLAQTLDDLDFYRYRTYTNENGVGVRDAPCRKGCLEFDPPIGKPMSYDIFL